MERCVELGEIFPCAFFRVRGGLLHYVRGLKRSTGILGIKLLLDA